MKIRSSSRKRIARYRAAQRERGLRPVVLWLPDVNNPGFWARLADECRQLAHLTSGEDAIAADFASLPERTERWR